jgi:preprotein translocase subunit SecF
VSEQVRQALATGFSVPGNQVASSFVGANWGSDVTSKALSGLLWFIALAAVAMALYFRTIKMSAAALIALVHDLVITAAIYGSFGFEVTPAAVIGFLTILGYSLYDTVVVFDKIRENTLEVEFSETATFKERVNLAINQTLVRSINTSVVAVLPVAAILFIGTLLLGAGTLRDISLALFIGILVGTYSTIFVAAPIYSLFREKEPKYAAAEAKVLANR